MGLAGRGLKSSALSLGGCGSTVELQAQGVFGCAVEFLSGGQALRGQGLHSGSPFFSLEGEKAGELGILSRSFSGVSLVGLGSWYEEWRASTMRDKFFLLYAGGTNLRVDRCVLKLYHEPVGYKPVEVEIPLQSLSGGLNVWPIEVDPLDTTWEMMLFDFQMPDGISTLQWNSKPRDSSGMRLRVTSAAGRAFQVVLNLDSNGLCVEEFPCGDYTADLLGTFSGSGRVLATQSFSVFEGQDNATVWDLRETMGVVLSRDGAGVTNPSGAFSVRLKGDTQSTGQFFSWASPPYVVLGLPVDRYEVLEIPQAPQLIEQPEALGRHWFSVSPGDIAIVSVGF